MTAGTRVGEGFVDVAVGDTIGGRGLGNREPGSYMEFEGNPESIGV